MIDSIAASSSIYSGIPSVPIFSFKMTALKRIMSNANIPPKALAAISRTTLQNAVDYENRTIHEANQVK